MSANWNPAKAATQRRRNAKKTAAVKKYRDERGCERCPENHPAVLDLHHRDPATKHPRLRVGGRQWQHLSLADIATELEKCIVLCSNCHRKLHYEEANNE